MCRDGFLGRTETWRWRNMLFKEAMPEFMWAATLKMWLCLFENNFVNKKTD